MSSPRYASIKFEVTGRVQGVFFRKYTKNKAEELGLTGWCRNTPHGSVEGEYEYLLKGEDNQQSSSSNSTREEATGGDWASGAFQHWLCNVGSPHSRIDECNFSKKVTSDSRRFEKFRVVR